MAQSDIAKQAMVQRDATIAEDHVLSGASCAILAKKYNLNKSTISRILNKDDPQSIINAGVQAKIFMIPKAIDVLWNFLRGKDDKHRYKAMERVFDDTGIGNAHTPPPNNTFINLLFAGNQAQDDTAELESVQQFLAWKMEHDVEEAEVVGDGGTSGPKEQP